MALKEFTRVDTDDSTLVELQDNIEQALLPLNFSPLAGARLVEVALVSGSDNLIEHKLGRAPVGWILVSPDADVRVWQSGTASPDASRVLLLQASASVNCKILVF